MTDTLGDCADVLGEAGFATRRTLIPEGEGSPAIPILAFEDATILGFIVAYDTPADLIASWEANRDRIAVQHRSALRAARQKAWNAYLVLLSRGDATFAEALILGQIEENLEALRKITKAGVSAGGGVRNALLPLLPFRAAPSLSPIDMREEIQARSTELGDRIVAAFLSNADEGVVMQLIEDQA